MVEMFQWVWAEPVESTETGARRRSRARSAVVRTMAPPPSEITQASSLWSGSAMRRDARTSSTVIGVRYMASGLLAALARAATGDHGQLLGGRAVLEHVALGRQGVGADDGPAVRGLELGRALDRRIRLRMRRSPEGPAHPGELIRAVADENGLAQTGLDRRRGVLDVELEARPAGHGAVGVGRRQAEVLDHDLHVVGCDVLPAGAGAAVAVDVAEPQPAIVEGPS